MLKLFTEQEANERAFTALTRFLDRLDVIPSRAPARPALDPLVLSFQLKLLWLSGYMPHLDGCVECGAEEGLVGFAPAAGGAVCADCGGGSIALSPDGLRGITTLVATPMSDAHDAGLTDRGAREALALVTASVRAPRRLPPPDALGVKKPLRDGYELDDSSERIDRDVVHRFISSSRTGASAGSAR